MRMLRWITGRKTEGTERHITEESKELLWLPLSDCILFLGNVDLSLGQEKPK